MNETHSWRRRGSFDARSDLLSCNVPTALLSLLLECARAAFASNSNIEGLLFAACQEHKV